MQDRINFEYATGGWSVQLQPGDIVSIAGVYRRRTLWQWLTRQPRVLQQFIVR